MPEISDAALVLALKGCSKEFPVEDAFELLVKRFERRIYAYCYLRLSHAELARDVTQEVFIAFFKNLAHYEPRASLSTYLIGIARNLCSQQLRAKSSRVSRENRSMEDTTEEPIEKANPAELAESAEEAEKLFSALAALREELREVVELRVFGGLAFHEIAELIGRPRSTVQDWFAEALHELRRALSNR